jgi:hypothetical protein
MTNLFSFRGVQDFVMIPNQQITLPEIILLPFNRPFSLTLIKCGDLLKIRGFIVNRNKIEKLMNESLEFSFGDESCIQIPFSFLIRSDKNGLTFFKRNDEMYCFINFLHDYFFNHKILMIKLKYSNFSVEVTNQTCDYNIEIVLDKYFLDEKEKTKYNLELDVEFCHNIRNIQHFKIPLNVIQNNLYIYRTDIHANLLTQGLFIVKDDVFFRKELYEINIKFNDNKIALDYDVKLLNVYNEDVGKLIYYGFNVGEKYDSTNVVGCLNLSKVDNVTITIIKKKLDESPDENPDESPDEWLDIYMPNWNILMYKQGLAGVKFL